MPGSSQGYDFKTTSIDFGHAKCCFVAFAAGVEKKGAPKVFRHPVLRQFLREFGDNFRNHTAEHVIGLASGSFHSCNDCRVVVADCGAHLARRKIEYLASRIVGNYRPLRFGKEIWKSVATITYKVFAGRISKIIAHE